MRAGIHNVRLTHTNTANESHLSDLFELEKGASSSMRARTHTHTNIYKHISVPAQKNLSLFFFFLHSVQITSRWDKKRNVSRKPLPSRPLSGPAYPSVQKDILLSLEDWGLDQEGQEGKQEPL